MENRSIDLPCCVDENDKLWLSVEPDGQLLIHINNNYARSDQSTSVRLADKEVQEMLKFILGNYGNLSAKILYGK